MYNLNNALYAANILKIKFNNFTPEDLLRGMNIKKNTELLIPKQM